MSTMYGGAGASESDSDRVVYVSSFDSASDGDWYRLVRDVVALANSGGGTVVIACRADERPADPACPRTIDLAASDVTHRIAQWTDSSFAEINVEVADRNSSPTVRITVGPAPAPISFTRDADGPDPGRAGEHTPVFSTGAFYFRRGGQSVPGTSADMREFFERRLRGVRSRWLREIRRVVTAPTEPANETVSKPASATRNRPPSNLQLRPVRIVSDPSAPALQPQDVDHLYPWRQKELVRELNRRLGRPAVNSYDVQAVRRQHHLDERPDFIFHLEGAGRRYSPAVAEWILQQYQRDTDFFARARAADHRMMSLRRRKPR